jgi:hypothetical protein
MDQLDLLVVKDRPVQKVPLVKKVTMVLLGPRDLLVPQV